MKLTALALVAVGALALATPAAAATPGAIETHQASRRACSPPSSQASSGRFAARSPKGNSPAPDRSANTSPVKSTRERTRERSASRNSSRP
jgi:hypothetical protein